MMIYETALDKLMLNIYDLTLHFNSQIILQASSTPHQHTQSCVEQTHQNREASQKVVNEDDTTDQVGDL